MKKFQELADNAERSMHAATPAAIRQGLDAVRALTEAVDGIQGPLIDLFRPSHARYNTAVEVIAGNQLFNVVVDNEDVATSVIEHLVSNRAGRVTLMPLSRLSEQHIEYPKDDDCRPLIEFLQYEPRFKAAVQQVFGRVLLCRSIEVASKFAKSHGFTCVTLEGDKVRLRANK
jgi:structural maintenance of chromosome 3 (chondroitin sulfate proteoglycan 6)